MHAARINIRSVQNAKGPHHGSSQEQKLFFRVLLLLVLLVCFGFGGIFVYNRLCQCDFFQITAVKISGNHLTSKEEIIALSRIDIHSSLLAINVLQLKSVLESHPWIGKAEVIRDWPNKLMINLKEKNPIALLNRDTGLFYLDGRGRIIAAPRPSQELDYPVITGLESYPFETVQSAQIPAPLQDVLELLRLAKRNNPILPEQNISELHVAGQGELILHLLDRPFPIYLGHEGKMPTRYHRLIKVLQDLYKKREFSEVSYIRLDYQQDTILVGKVEAKTKGGKHSKGV